MPVSLHRLKVVLVSPRNPLNIGAAARAMSNFGFAELRLTNAYDVAFREARSAIGAADLLQSAREYGSVADAVSDCSLVVGTTSVGHRSLQHSLRRLELGGQMVREALESGNVALLFGSEKFGLSNEDLSYCHWLMRIPSRETGSMNLGQAVAVCLYELIRETDAQTHQPRDYKPASAEQLDRFTVRLLDVLARTGYLNPTTSVSTEEKIRRLVRRLDLSARDAVIWLGIVRQILWKLGSEQPGAECRPIDYAVDE